jgi:hypothetical protein
MNRLARRYVDDIIRNYIPDDDVADILRDAMNQTHGYLPSDSTSRPTVDTPDCRLAPPLPVLSPAPDSRMPIAEILQAKAEAAYLEPLTPDQEAELYILRQHASGEPIDPHEIKAIRGCGHAQALQFINRITQQGALELHDHLLDRNIAA